MPEESAQPTQNEGAGSGGKPMTRSEVARHASLVRWGKKNPLAARLAAIREKRKKGGGGKGKAPKKPTKTPAEKETERARQMVANVEAVGEALNESDNAMLSKNGLAGLISAANGEEPPVNVAQGLIDSGLAIRGEDGRYRLTADGSAIVRAAESGDTSAVLDRLSAVNDKNIAAAEKEKAKAEKEKEKQGKGGGGGGGSQEKETDEEKAAKKEQERAATRAKTAKDVGLSTDEAEFLAGAASGTLPDGSFDASNLMTLGLVVDTGDTTEATDAGRRALAALERGDVRAYRAAVQDAKEKQERTQAREAARKQRQADRRAREDARRQREDERRRQEDGDEAPRKPGRERRGPTRPPVSTMPATKALDVDSVYQRYHETVNMSASELEAWAETEASRRASLDRSPIRRNLRLLRKPKAEWTAVDIRDANRTIAFVSRMRGAEQGKPVSEDIPYSKRDISLRNWAYAVKHGAHDQSSHRSRGTPLERLSAIRALLAVKAQGDAPNYRMAAENDRVIGQLCGTCLHARPGNYCHLFDFVFTPGMVCDAWASQSAAETEKPHMNISPDVVRVLTAQITLERTANAAYLGIATWADAQAYLGLQGWANAAAVEEMQHAQTFINFLNDRAVATLESLAAPQSEFSSYVDALTAALRIEQAVSRNLQLVVTAARASGDEATALLAGEYLLREQVPAEKEVTALIQKARRTQDLDLFDHELFEDANG